MRYETLIVALRWPQSRNIAYDSFSISFKGTQHKTQQTKPVSLFIFNFIFVPIQELKRLYSKTLPIHKSKPHIFPRRREISFFFFIGIFLFFKWWKIVRGGWNFKATLFAKLKARNSAFMLCKYRNRLPLSRREMDSSWRLLLLVVLLLFLHLVTNVLFIREQIIGHWGRWISLCSLFLYLLFFKACGRIGALRVRFPWSATVINRRSMRY